MASKLKANSHRPFLGFGKLFLKTNDVVQAEKALNTALRMKRDDPEILREIGKLYDMKRQKGTAYSYFVKAFEHDKADLENIEHIYNAGSALEEWESMKKVFEESLEYRPANISIMKCLSSTYYELREYEKAKELLERGLAFDQCDPELNEMYVVIKQAIDMGSHPNCVV